jgi:DNA replication protein DnaC
MNDELAEPLKYLRLGGLLANWDEYLKLGAEKRFSHGTLLTHVVREEYRIRRENARKQRLARAAIKDMYVIETFPFERQPKLNKKKVMALYDSASYLTQARNILWLGGTGVGKTGLATSFLVGAINQGYSGRFVWFPDLAEELYRSVADHSEAEVIKRYAAVDLLAIDEVGYVHVEPVQAGHFFKLLQMRHKKKPTLITSNLGFGDWRSFLKSDHLTAALIDRLTETSYVFNMKDCVTIREKLPQDP